MPSSGLSVSKRLICSHQVQVNMYQLSSAPLPVPRSISYWNSFRCVNLEKVLPQWIIAMETLQLHILLSQHNTQCLSWRFLCSTNLGSCLSLRPSICWQRRSRNQGCGYLGNGINFLQELQLLASWNKIYWLAKINHTIPTLNLGPIPSTLGVRITYSITNNN